MSWSEAPPAAAPAARWRLRCRSPAATSGRCIGEAAGRRSTAIWRRSRSTRPDRRLGQTMRNFLIEELNPRACSSRRRTGSTVELQRGEERAGHPARRHRHPLRPQRSPPPSQLNGQGRQPRPLSLGRSAASSSYNVRSRALRHPGRRAGRRAPCRARGRRRDPHPAGALLRHGGRAVRRAPRSPPVHPHEARRRPGRALPRPARPGVATVLVYGPDAGLVRRARPRLSRPRSTTRWRSVPRQRARRRPGRSGPPAWSRRRGPVPAGRPPAGAGARGGRSARRRAASSWPAAAGGLRGGRGRRARRRLEAAPAGRGRPHAVALPCYRDEGRDLGGLRHAASGRARPRASRPRPRPGCASHLGGDRASPAASSRSWPSIWATRRRAGHARRRRGHGRRQRRARARRLVHPRRAGDAAALERCLDRLLGEGHHRLRPGATRPTSRLRPTARCRPQAIKERRRRRCR